MEKNEKELKILLVEDDPFHCRSLCKFIDATESVQLAGVTNNFEKAVECFKACEPNVLILDLDLKNGKETGVQFLERVFALDVLVFPFVFASSSSIASLDKARELGADFVMAKGAKNFSAENIIEFVASMKSAVSIKQKRIGISGGLKSLEDTEEITKRITNIICAELELIGVSPKVKGRKYLIDAIQMTMIDPRPNLSREIAEKYNKSPESVERAMANAVINAWDRTDHETFLKYCPIKFRKNRKRPSLSEVVCHYADKIKSIL